MYRAAAVWRRSPMIFDFRRREPSAVLSWLAEVYAPGGATARRPVVLRFLARGGLSGPLLDPVVAIGAQCGCTQQIMSKRIPQGDGADFGEATHPELLQAPIACVGVHAFRRTGTLQVNFLGHLRRHPRAPLGHRRRVIGAGSVGVP